MSKLFTQSQDGLTEASWRSKFYGFIREGKKERVSPFALKAAFVVASVLISLFQLVSAFKPETKKTVASAIGLPATGTAADEKLNVPLYDPARSASDADRNSKARLARPIVVERIQRIRLAGISGIPTGTEAPAILSSGGTNGTVIARMSENLSVDGDVLLPKGTVLFGKGSSSDERLYIKFRKAILPDKSEQSIKAQAFDSKDRMVGLKGKKISDVAFKIAASSSLIFLSGLADGLKENQSTNIFGDRKPSVHDAALNGVATATSEQGKRLLDSMNREDSRVEVQASTSIVVVFGDDSSQEN